MTAVPIDATSYERALGRLKELEELEHAMVEHRAALVHGPAGVGKTRLLRTFADGRKGFIYTAETESPSQLLKGLARQLSACSMLSGRACTRFSALPVSSQKGTIQSILASHTCVLILDQLCRPSAALSRLIKDLHYMGRTPMVIGARSRHMEDIGTLFPLVAQRSQQISIADWNKETALEFARQVAFQVGLEAEGRDELLQKIAHLSRGNPGAIACMTEMAKFPCYRVNNLVKVNTLYVDFRMAGQRSRRFEV